MAKKPKSDTSKSVELSEADLDQAKGGILIGLLKPTGPSVAGPQVSTANFDANLPVGTLAPKDPIKP